MIQWKASLWIRYMTEQGKEIPEALDEWLKWDKILKGRLQKIQRWNVQFFINLQPPLST